MQSRKKQKQHKTNKRNKGHTFKNKKARGKSANTYYQMTGGDGKPEELDKIKKLMKDLKITGDNGDYIATEDDLNVLNEAVAKKKEEVVDGAAAEKKDDGAAAEKKEDGAAKAEAEDVAEKKEDGEEKKEGAAAAATGGAKMFGGHVWPDLPPDTFTEGLARKEYDTLEAKLGKAFTDGAGKDPNAWVKAFKPDKKQTPIGPTPSPLAKSKDGEAEVKHSAGFLRWTADATEEEEAADEEEEAEEEEEDGAQVAVVAPQTAIKFSDANHPHNIIISKEHPVEIKLLEIYIKFLQALLKKQPDIKADIDTLITAIQQYDPKAVPVPLDTVPGASSTTKRDESIAVIQQISPKQQTVERVTIGTDPTTTMIPLFKKPNITYCMESSSDKVIIWYKTNGKDGQKYEATNDAEFLEANRRMDSNP